MVDHQRKLLFIHIARTGGTSIEAACVGQDWFKIERTTKHLSASQMHRHYGDSIWHEYTTFTVVRNPWDRLVSMWNTRWWHKAVADAGGLPLEKLSDLATNFTPHPNEIYRSRFYHEILDEPVDHVLRFESLQTDFSRMLAGLGEPDLRLPFIQKRQRENYRDYYDEATRDLVARIHRRDIENFGYTF